MAQFCEAGASVCAKNLGLIDEERSMARVTVEDCLENVENRFELVMVASKRAREIAVRGAQPHVEWENDKPTVVALREIAEGFVNAKILNED